MDDPVSKIPEHVKIKLNQNIWAFAVSIAVLGASEHYNLPRTMYWSELATIASTISLIITVGYYTYHYRWKKLRKAQSEKNKIIKNEKA